MRRLAIRVSLGRRGGICRQAAALVRKDRAADRFARLGVRSAGPANRRGQLRPIVKKWTRGIERRGLEWFGSGLRRGVYEVLGSKRGNFDPRVRPENQHDF